MWDEMDTASSAKNLCGCTWQFMVVVSFENNVNNYIFLTPAAITKFRFPTGHGTMTQSDSNSSGFSSNHSDSINWKWKPNRRIYLSNTPPNARYQIMSCGLRERIISKQSTTCCWLPSHMKPPRKNRKKISSTTIFRAIFFSCFLPCCKQSFDARHRQLCFASPDFCTWLRASSWLEQPIPCLPPLFSLVSRPRHPQRVSARAPVGQTVLYKTFFSFSFCYHKRKGCT